MSMPRLKHGYISGIAAAGLTASITIERDDRWSTGYRSMTLKYLPQCPEDPTKRQSGRADRLPLLPTIGLGRRNMRLQGTRGVR
jgi:hypothetical protein